MPSQPARLNAMRLSIITASRRSSRVVRPPEHRVFARHLVGEGRHAEAVFDTAADIKVGHAGFDHDHIRALREVALNEAHRLV